MVMGENNVLYEVPEYHTKTWTQNDMYESSPTKEISPTTDQISSSIPISSPQGVQTNGDATSRTELDEINAAVPSKAHAGNFDKESVTCPICEESFVSVQACESHEREIHINPEFVVQTNDVIKSGSKGQSQKFRCHSCLALFSLAKNLKKHLVHHAASSDMAPKTDSDTVSSPGKCRNRILEKHSRSEKIRTNGEHQDNRPKNKSFPRLPNQSLKSRPQRHASRNRYIGLEADASDEFNSNSENEADISNRKVFRPQRECKTRTKTLVAISLAEQDYEKFDLDFGKFKTDVNNPGQEHEGADSSFDDIPSSSCDFIADSVITSSVPATEENKSDDLSSKSNEEIVPLLSALSKPTNNTNSTKSVSSEERKGSKEQTTAKKKAKENIKCNPSKGGKRLSDTRSKKRKGVSPARANHTDGRKGKVKCPHFSLKDRKKASKLVLDIVEGSGEYVCLSCGKHFKSYGILTSHKIKCSQEKVSMMGVSASSKKEIKREDEEDFDRDMSQYITGSVIQVPETSFNNMHGKLTDIKTEDANLFLNSAPNALGLVKLNYSGPWSIKDVWEAGGWEPRPGQLTWQPYELAAAVQSDVEALSAAKESESNKMANTSQEISRAQQNSDDRNRYDEEKTANKTIANSSRDPSEVSAISPSPTVAALTRKLTSQVVGRQPPVITNPSLERQFLLKLARIPWTEQKKLKDCFDNSINPKKTKKVDKLPENHFRHPTMPNKLDLRQIGKSVKYSKNRAKILQKKPEFDTPMISESGTLSGEWETEHSFLCSVCGIEYDDVLEIMHHKWEAHPHCLVTHVSLKHNLHRPPALLYPQVGPSTIPLKQQVKSESLDHLTCSKCNMLCTDGAEFHAHILECGGLSLWDRSPSKRKRRKGHGGGLKSTVRMLKKTSQSRDGTDTDEPSPKKRIRPPPRDFSNIPLVPTHNRTTRFKESKEKEALLLQAKNRSRQRRRQKESKTVDKVVAGVVSDLVDKVNDKEKRRLRRSTEIESSQRRRSMSSRRLQEDRGNSRRSSTRLQNSRMYREVSSEDSMSDNDIVPERTPRGVTSNSEKIPKEIIDTVNSLIEKVISIVERSAQACKNHSDGKLLHVKIIDDSASYPMSDHSRLQLAGETVQETPGKRSSKKRSRSSSVENQPEDVKGMIKTTGDKVPSTRIQKRLHSDLSPKMLGTKIRKRRMCSRPVSPAHTSKRSIVPLDLKVSVIKRIENGEVQSNVATDLQIPISNVAKWWISRKDICDRYYQTLSETSMLTTDRTRSRSLSDSSQTPIELRSSLDEKCTAFERVLNGESKASVAKYLCLDAPAIGLGLTEKQPSPENKTLETNDTDQHNLNEARSVSSNDGVSPVVQSLRDSGDDVMEENFMQLSNGDHTSSHVSDEQKMIEPTKEENFDDLVVANCSASKTAQIDSYGHSRNDVFDDADKIDEKKGMAKKKFERKNSISSQSSDGITVIEEVVKEAPMREILEIVKENLDKEKSVIKENKRPRRHSVGISNNLSASGFRLLIPVDVKREALKKIAGGESQANVARDLDLSASTVASWWRKKESILTAEDLSQSESNEAIEDQTVEELVKMEKSGTDRMSDAKQKEFSASEKLNVTPPLDSVNLVENKDELLKSMKCAFSRETESLGSPTSNFDAAKVTKDLNGTCKGTNDESSSKAFQPEMIKETAIHKPALLSSSNTRSLELDKVMKRSDCSFELAEDFSESTSTIRDRSTLNSNEDDTQSKAQDAKQISNLNFTDEKKVKNADFFENNNTPIIEPNKPSKFQEVVQEDPGIAPIEKTSSSTILAVSIRSRDSDDAVKDGSSLHTNNCPAQSEGYQHLGSRKRKSLEFLANSLMKKALAHTANPNEFTYDASESTSTGSITGNSEVERACQSQELRTFGSQISISERPMSFEES